MQTCPKCEGKGRIRGTVDWFLGLMTVGVTALMDLSQWEECDSCDGKGYIREKL